MGVRRLYGRVGIEERGCCRTRRSCSAAVVIYLWLGLFVAGLACGFGVEAKRWHNADVERELAAAKEAESVTHKTDEVVTVYVDRIQKVDVPVPVVRTRLIERVCPGNSPGVPNPSGAAAAAAPDTGDQLARELGDTVRNRYQLEALIAAVRANNVEHP